MPATWFESISDIFFPPVCLICRKRIKSDLLSFPFCVSCSDKVSRVGCFCLRCKGTGLKKLPCSCESRRHLFHKLFGIAWYEGKWRELLHDFKYHSQQHLAQSIGRMLGELLVTAGGKPEFDMVTPVPLHPVREKERGYNQSSLLARRVGKELDIPFKNVISRNRNTLSQTTLSGQDRKVNMSGAFSYTGKTCVKGKKILIIDDIVTTGSTLKEAGRILAEAGAREVCGAVAAIQRKTG